MKFTRRLGRSEAQSHLIRRIKAAVFDFVMRLAPSRPISHADLTDADFSTHPGHKALRFTERLRDSFRKTWLRLRKPD